MCFIELIVLAVFVTICLTIIIFNLKSPGKRIDHQFSDDDSLDSDTVKRSLGQLLGPPLVAGNLISPLSNGDEIFPEMLSAIVGAKKTITFETFIYWSGKIGGEFANALSERARAGCRVHVLLDWVGSRQFQDAVIHDMINAGVQVERYRPLRWYSVARFNNRTHRKLLVIDGKIGFTGGVGIADQWLGASQDKDHWRDAHFKVQGPVVAQLQAAFMDNWLTVSAKVLDGDDYFPEIASCGEQIAQVFKSSPEEGSGSVRLMYLFAIAHAKHKIRIANAYFVPDSHVRSLLIRAARRGVDIQVIVPGDHIDTPLTRGASRAVWGDLLQAGIKILEFEPTMFHCKYMIVDDIWISVGSTNLDNRSFRLNDESNLNVIDKNLAAKMEKIFAVDRSRSTEVTYKQWIQRPMREKILDWLASLFKSQV